MQYQGTGKTEEEARRKLNKKIRDVKAGKATKEHKKERGTVFLSRNSTVDDCAQVWLSEQKNRIRPPSLNYRKNSITQKSFDNYLEKYNIHIKPVFGRKRIEKITKDELQSFLDSMEEDGYSASHCGKLIIILRNIFAVALKYRAIVEDVSEGIYTNAEIRENRRSLTDEERTILERVAKTHRGGDWILFLLDTGLRRGESAALKVNNLDFKEHIIRVTSAVESGTSEIARPKTRAGIRSVPMSRRLTEILQRLTANKSPDDFVFTKDDGRSMMTNQVMNDIWRSFKREMDILMGAETTNHGHVYDPADLRKDGTPMYPDKDGKPRNGHKLDQNISLHYLRHTFCTDLQKSNVGIVEASKIMGHSDINITAKIYSHSDLSTIKDAAAKLDALADKRNSF